MRGEPDARWEHQWEDDAPPADFPGHAVPGACVAQERRPPICASGHCLATGMGMPQCFPSGMRMPQNFPPPPCFGAAAAGVAASASRPVIGEASNFPYQQLVWCQPQPVPLPNMGACYAQHLGAASFTAGASSSGACPATTCWVPSAGSSASGVGIQARLPALNAQLMQQLEVTQSGPGVKLQ